MSAPHYSQDDLNRDFLRESVTQSRLGQWPDGRVGHDDDGATTYAIATDVRHRIIRIQFPKPTLWIGLDQKSAEELRDHLDTRLLELRGIKASS